MKKVFIIFLSICFIISLMQCKSEPEVVEETPEPVEEPTPVPVDDDVEFDASGIARSIKVLADGLSPNDDGFKDQIAFSIALDQKDKIASWKLGMKHDSTGNINKEFSGTDAPPESIGWDGKDNGEIVMQGKYKALLTLEYKESSTPVTIETETFMLDVTPPELRLESNPSPFSPDGDGVNDVITITFTINDASPVYKWDIEIFDEEGELFHTIKGGAGDSRRKILWNGKNDAGHIVEIASDYKAVLTVTDNCMNTGKTETIIPVDILVVKTADNRYKIKIGNIIFKAYKSDFKDMESGTLSSNMVSFKQLSRLMKKYPEYDILIEGHAMMPRDKVHNKAAFDKYNTEVLIPLSKKRAEDIKKELIKLGVESDRIFTEGLGASVPLVPHDDFEKRWMNRRVEFYLLKN